MIKEEYESEILNLKFNEHWLNSQIMEKYNCTYPELRVLLDKYLCEKGN